jgi:putative FmdB family regulatory protein
MFKSYDFQCQQCKHVFDDLIQDSEPNPLCPLCKASTDKLFGNHTTAPHNVKMSELMMKGREAYNRMKDKPAHERGR